MARQLLACLLSIGAMIRARLECSSEKEWMRCRIKTRPGSIIPHPHWADKIRPELLDGEEKKLAASFKFQHVEAGGSETNTKNYIQYSERFRWLPIMPSRRAALPAASEPELDILDSLYPGDDDNGGQGMSKDGQDGLDFDAFLNAGAAGGGEEDDEAFIALQQAASYRKASNLKGRTVKKGGGFQAMGELESLRKTGLCDALALDQSNFLILNLYRSQCEPSQGHRSQRILSPDPDSEKDDPPGSRAERRRRHGQNRFRKNCGIRHPHD